MSDNPFYSPMAEWQTGDVLSSTKLNQLLGNLDYVYGLDQSMVIGIAAQPLVNDATYQYERSQWDGYIAHTGDTLVYEFATPRAGRHIVYHPGATQFRFSAALSGQRTQLLPPYFGASANRYRVFRVTVENDDPNAEGATQPLYIYSTSSTAAAVGPPYPWGSGFNAGAIPTADNFNGLIDGMETLRAQLEKPVGYSRARFEWPNDVLQATDLYPYYGSITYYAPYRHTWFRFFLTAAPGTPQEHPERLSWSVTSLDGTNEQEFWSRDLYNSYPAQDYFAARIGDLGLAVNTWYTWTFKHTGASNYSGPRGFSRIYWAGQQRTDTAGNWTPMPRWKLGDVAYSSGTPDFATVISNITWLDTNRRNDHNYVSRANMSNDYTVYNETFFTRRVHRWLAYQTSTDRPSLRYGITTEPRLQSVTIPDGSGTQYLDLDATPIRPGMVMYLSGVKFAIQVPRIPG